LHEPENGPGFGRFHDQTSVPFVPKFDDKRVVEIMDIEKHMLAFGMVSSCHNHAALEQDVPREIPNGS
jgi:hypothetical protein